MTSARERMLAGLPYDPGDEDLDRRRRRARELVGRYNATTSADLELRRGLLEELLGGAGQRAWIEPPFFCDYGENVFLGERGYLNAGCVLLDCAYIEIGARALLGPAVQLYAATHSTDPAQRATGLELARPIKIGADVWIGGAAVICPGVTIGDGSTVGAGSVVTGDVPPRAVAAGNPCRVLRFLD